MTLMKGASALGKYTPAAKKSRSRLTHGEDSRQGVAECLKEVTATLQGDGCHITRGSLPLYRGLTATLPGGGAAT